MSGTDRTEEWDIVYQDDYLIVTSHDEERVAIWTGNPPEDDRPTIVDATELRDALTRHLTSDDGVSPGFVTEFEQLNDCDEDTGSDQSENANISDGETE